MRLLPILCALVLASACEAQSGDPHRDRPNVVIFLTDDQSHEDFGFLGGDVLTPNLDRVASEGVVFDNMHVPVALCTPSRYAILTGRYPAACSSPDFLELHPPGAMVRVENNVELEDDRPNLPRLLQLAGYRTGFVGKSHMIGDSVFKRRSAWRRAGLLTYAQNADPRDAEVSAKMRANHDWWAERIREHGFDEADAVYAANLRELYNSGANVHNPEWTIEAANGFIERNAGAPFFLYIAITVPHGPDPWTERQGALPHSLDADPRMSGAGYLDAPPNAGMPSRESVRDRVADAGLDVRTKHHATWIDDAVGSVLATLDAQGIAGDTLFLFMADHGSRRHGKATTYDNGIKVPAIARWPGVIKPGARADALLSSIDIAPTLLELAGAQPDDIQGKSFAHVLTDPGAQHREFIYAELGYARAIKTKDWKYIAVRYPDPVQRRIERGGAFPAFQGGEIDRPYLTVNGHLGHNASLRNPHYHDPDQLYDLRADPFETTNLFTQGDPDLVASLQAELKRHLRRFPGRPFGEFVPHD